MSGEQKLTDLVSSKMIAITNEFIKDPIAAIFVNPYVPDENIADNYYKVVKTPMDLKTLKRGISEGKYKTLSQWISDFNLIFENAINYNGIESLYGGIAKYLQNKFQTKCKDLEYQNLKTIEDQLIKLRNKMALLMANPPVKGGIKPTIQELDTPSIDWSTTRLHNLMEKLNEAIKENANEKIYEILKIDRPTDNETKIDISLNKLTRNQLLELETLVA
ncbi:Bromodomain containing protein [Trichomonas vaginalis G3]|uniref:Bromodomain containing protein n=1 Tax=Trichomonas vaginalis (strain ATCC PRA-98 / G3) TaxID=412133 RepID=A2FR73_TRIV3|nr:negative regulation of protein autoubiquitination [Trichomonas vaginalis G3]EAX92589.1 Bromodomain containing protein [Trichomonas vaginalis G3]KAI5533832.1 negative regulation of protein autoubiquitination [Trichomonas vaginalis G3]|eukprot:XP_001305519.1 Bromodomain containing protein [Trichomonas vaginalis G3]